VLAATPNRSYETIRHMDVAFTHAQFIMLVDELI